MKKIFFVMMCLLNTIWASAQFSGSGSGTASDPYRIIEASELDQVRNFLGKSNVYFKLMDDIDLTDWIDDNNPMEGWSPIGTESSPFEGIIDGNNKTISGLRINRGETDYIGLFGFVSNAIFKNLTLTGTTVSGANYTGTLVGCASGVTISGVKVSFTSIKGQNYTGGLIGHGLSSTISLSSTDIKIDVLTVSGKTNYYHGGILGGNSSATTITNCTQSGKVEGSKCVGGVVGYSTNAITIESTVSRSKVSGKGNNGSNIGGLIGQSESAVTITSCTHYEDVNGSSLAPGNVGGLIGLCSGATITKSSAYGNVSGTNNVGGLVGEKSESTGRIDIQHSFACGNINGRDHVGGLVGAALKVNSTRFLNSNYYNYVNKLSYSYGVSTVLRPLNYYYSTASSQGVVLEIDRIKNNQGDWVYEFLLGERDKVNARLSKSKYEVGDDTAFPGKVIIHAREANNYECGSYNEDYMLYRVIPYSDSYYSYKFDGRNQFANCYYNGVINGTNDIGGIVGFAQTSDIVKNYANANILGNSIVGGIVGKLDAGESHDGNSTLKSNVAINATVSASVSDAGRIYGSMNEGWTIGTLGSSEANKAMLTTVVSINGTTQSIREDLQNGNTVGKATLMRKSTYQGVGWDMTNDWNIQDTESHPYKPWQAAPPVILAGVTAGSTSINGKCVDAGQVCVETGNKQYKATIVGNSWTAEVEPLQAGTQVSVYAESESKYPSYRVTSYVSYSGSGTADDPYQISTAADLAGISGSSCYKLMNDIDLTDWIEANSKETGWIPIGRYSAVAFSLDGDNHLISGLWAKSDEDNIGLIAHASGATIKNLTIQINPSKKVKGGNYTAALLTNGSSVTILNCHVTGDVEGKQNSALLAGQITDGVVDSCSVSGNVTATGNSGGLIASSGAKVTNSSSGGSVTAIAANALVGGLIGENTGVVEKSISTAIVNSSGKGTSVGGLAGYSQGTISKSASNGNVNAGTDAKTGGIVGETGKTSIINDCYSTSNITGTAYVGGIVGYNYGKVNRCYASGSITGTGVGAGISAYNCGTEAKVLSSVALCSKINMNESSGTAKRVIGGYKDGAPDPLKSDNFALSEMLIAINGTFQPLSDNLLNGTSASESTLKQSDFYNKASWDMSSLWKINEGNGYPYIEFSNIIFVDTIILSSDTLGLVEGNTIQLTATVTPTNASNKGLTWTSNNTDVATVGANGLVTAVSAGTATITCTAQDGSGVSATCTIEVTEKPQPCVADGDYLIENIEGGYLGGGNDWGTHATLLGKPQWFTAAVLEDGKYTLNSYQSNGGDNHYLAGDLYTDGAAYEWTITKVSDGIYTIANADGKLITASDGMNNLLSLTEGDVPNSAKWKFVSMTEIVTGMNNASENSPVDVTALIKDPELKRSGNNMWNAWVVTGYDGVSKVKNFSQGQKGNVANCTESWHSSNGFKAVQTIPLPKAGVYTLTAQGFYRQDDGMEEEPSYLFAGEQKSILPNLTGTENNMVEAYAAFLAKKYPVEPITITTTEDNESLQIGFAGNATNMWNIFGELELKYYGTDKSAEGYFSPVATDGETVQYLYNIEAKGFVLGANDWGTRASVNPETGYKFKVKANGDGTYTLNDYCLGNDKKTWMWGAMFADSGIGIWVDNVNGANVNKWVITPVAGENNVYEITNPSAAQGKLGVKTDLSDTRLYINNIEGYSTRWAFMSEEQYEQYMSDFAIDIENTKQKILDAKNTISLAAWKDIIDDTNIYDTSGYNAYVQQYNDYTSQLVAGTLKEEVINPSTPTDWHASTAYNFLLTPWTIGGEVCNNFDKALYINTWSKEGETDGSNFLVPFFEYWTNDDSSLGTNSIATKVSNLEPNSTYEVKLLARVRIKNNATGTPYGISMTVGDGESICLCDGNQVGNTQMYLAEFAAQGSVDKKGDLYVNIDIANDNNVNWLAFKNVKYTKVADAPALVSSITLSHNTLEMNEGETAQLTATVAPSDAANKSVSWISGNTAVATVNANGLVTAIAAGTATITCSAQDGSGVSATCTINVSGGIVPCIADGDYLIENVEAGYLGGGNAWGTTASLLGKPQWFAATVLVDGKYTLNSYQSNGGESHYLAGDLYTDGAAYGWTITKVSNGVYTIANADGKLITASDGMNNPLSLTDNGIPNSAKWKFVSMEEIVSGMSNASETNPVDVTSLIKDPEFKRNGNNMWNAWAITGFNGEDEPTNFAEGQGGNNANCAESWHSSNGFKALQTISLPKTGVYTLTAQGFYRQDDGMTEEPSYLFAGGQKSILPVLTGEENNMVEAYAAFLAKKYPVTPIVITATQANQAIEIGFAGEATNMWNIFGELELKYYGTDAPGLTDINHVSAGTSKYGKILENGKIVIIKDGKKYNVNGLLLK